MKPDEVCDAVFGEESRTAALPRAVPAWSGIVLIPDKAEWSDPPILSREGDSA